MNPMINPQQVIDVRMGAIPNMAAVPYNDLANISSLIPQFEDEDVQITRPVAGTDAIGRPLPESPLPSILARARQARELLLLYAKNDRKTAWSNMLKDIGIGQESDVKGDLGIKTEAVVPDKPKRVIGYRGMLNEPIYEDNSKPYSTMQVAADGEESPTSPQSFNTAEEYVRKDVNYNDVELTESEQSESGVELYKKELTESNAKYMPPIVTTTDGKVIDGHHRILATKGTTIKIPSLQIETEIYNELKKMGYDSSDISYGVLKLANETEAMDNIESQFLNSTVAKNGYEVSEKISQLTSELDKEQGKDKENK